MPMRAMRLPLMGWSVYLPPLNMTYSMVFRISACMIMLCAGILAVGGDLSFANLAVILIASFTIFNPIEVMGQMTTMIRTMDAALDRVERIKQAKKIDENGRDIPLDSFDIGFEHVSFAYENGNPILKDVSFSIPQGSMTAIVGPSGGGKTTIITRLIARFVGCAGRQHYHRRPRCQRVYL